jgi:hypothetical protein
MVEEVSVSHVTFPYRLPHLKHHPFYSWLLEIQDISCTDCHSVSINETISCIVMNECRFSQWSDTQRFVANDSTVTLYEDLLIYHPFVSTCYILSAVCSPYFILPCCLHYLLYMHARPWKSRWARSQIRAPLHSLSTITQSSLYFRHREPPFPD